MGQKLRDDKIGALSHSSGVITLTSSTASPSWLTIGGQQYKLTSNRTLALPTLTANTLYMIYAVQTAGVVSLVQSTNVNSVGPVGYASWKLVGAYYSNNLVSVSFGNFVTIDGTPTGDWVILNNTVGSSFLTGGVSNPSFGTVATNIVKARRVGRELVYEWDYRQTGAGGAGSGTYFINVPFTIDWAYHKASNTQPYVGNVGYMSVIEETSGQYAGVNNVFLPSNTTTQLAVRLGQVSNSATMNQDWSSSYSHFAVATFEFGLRAKFPVVGWSNTPLKDL